MKTIDKITIKNLIDKTTSDNVDTLRSTIVNIDLNKYMTNGLLPLQYACSVNNEYAIKILIESNTINNDNLKLSICYSIKYPNFKIAIFILEKITEITHNDIEIIDCVFKHTPGTVISLFDKIVEKFTENKNIFLLNAINIMSEKWINYLIHKFSGQTDSNNYYTTSPFDYVCSRSNDYIFKIVFDSISKTLDKPTLIRGITIAIQYNISYNISILLDLYIESFSTQELDTVIITNIIKYIIEKNIILKKFIQHFETRSNVLLSYIYSYYDSNNGDKIIQILKEIEKIITLDYSANHIISEQPLLFHIVTQNLQQNKEYILFTNIPIIKISGPYLITSVSSSTYSRITLNRNRERNNYYDHDDDNDNRNNYYDYSDDDGARDAVLYHDYANSIKQIKKATNIFMEFHINRTNDQIDLQLSNKFYLSEYYLDLIETQLVNTVDQICPVNDVYLNRLFLYPVGDDADSINYESILKYNNNYNDLITLIITKNLVNILDIKKKSGIINLIKLFVSYGYDVNILYDNILEYILQNIDLLRTFINWKLYIKEDVFKHVLRFTPDKYPIIIELLKCGVTVSQIYYPSMINMLNDTKIISNPIHDNNVNTIKNYMLPNNDYTTDIDLREEKNIGLIQAHGSIVSDKYIVLPDTVGIYVLTKREDVAYYNSDLLTLDYRKHIVEGYPNQYVHYYHPGSVIQEQTLHFYLNFDEYLPINGYHLDDKYNRYSNGILKQQNIKTRGIILTNTDDYYSHKNNTTTHDNITEVIIDDKNNMIKSFIIANTDTISLRDDIMRYNDDKFFSKNELWNINKPENIKLSEIIRRAKSRNIKCDFILATCRSGYIWDQDLHLQACRSLYKKSNKHESDLKSRQIDVEDMKLLRRNSSIFSDSNFHSDVHDFYIKYYNINMLQLVDNNKILVWNETKFNIRTTIMNRYINDKFFNKKHNSKIYKTDKVGIVNRYINPLWYKAFTREIKIYLTTFIKNITDRIKYNFSIHTVEYCNMYALVYDNNIPYISSMSIECMKNKKKYLEICMMK